MTNMYLCYTWGWVAIDFDLPEVQAAWKVADSPPWESFDMKHREYERHMRLAELTKQWQVPVEVPPSSAIKLEGWMYYDPDLFLLED